MIAGDSYDKRSIFLRNTIKKIFTNENGHRPGDWDWMVLVGNPDLAMA